MAQRRTSDDTYFRHPNSPVRAAAVLYGIYIALYLAFAGVVQVSHLLSSALVTSAMASSTPAGDPAGDPVAGESVDLASPTADDTGECAPPSTVTVSAAVSD